jgi:hypothetical protein
MRYVGKSTRMKQQLPSRIKWLVRVVYWVPNSKTSRWRQIRQHSHWTDPMVASNGSSVAMFASHCKTTIGGGWLIRSSIQCTIGLIRCIDFSLQPCCNPLWLLWAVRCSQRMYPMHWLALSSYCQSHLTFRCFIASNTGWIRCPHCSHLGTVLAHGSMRLFGLHWTNPVHTASVQSTLFLRMSSSELLLNF